MNRTSLLLCLLLVTLSARAQEVKELLGEHFDNNFRQWSEKDTDKYSRYIAKGKMHMVTKADYYHWCGHGIPVDKKKNFKIESEVTFTKFKSGVVGIIWGGSDDYKKIFAFTISPNGTYNYGQWAPKFQSFTGSLRSDAIKKGVGTVNKLTVQKDGRTLRLLVNDIEVHSTTFKKLYGNEVGLVAGGGVSTAEVDSFVFAEIDQE
ncbi:MAG TPA: hypothetical protein VD927_13470 [Chryseosolibacter sp.]|nr:hypothetical protein [Chryseosolibacter sp.]